MMDVQQTINRIRYIPARVGLQKKKHLFIHIPKNGGMSIRRAPQLKGQILTATRKRLISRQYADTLLATMESYGHHHGYHHARLIDVDASVRKASVPFAALRNPWCRVFSRFTFGLQGQKEIDSKEELRREFEAFLEERHQWGGVEYFWHRAVRGWYPQADYVVDETGKIAVNLLRFENLDGDFRNYFNVDMPLRPRNRTVRMNVRYTEVYTDKLIQDVADWYQRDIELFGFDFVGSATKNTYFT